MTESEKNISEPTTESTEVQAIAPEATESTTQEAINEETKTAAAIAAEPEEKQKKRRRQQSHDMNDDNFDYIVMGTNLSENILAA